MQTAFLILSLGDSFKVSKRIFNSVVFGALALGILMVYQYAYADDKKAVIAVPIISQLVKQKTNGQWGGALIDVLKKVESKADIPFEMRVVPFKRAVMMTKNGNSDFGVFMESPKRNQMAMPVLKLGDAVYVLLTLKENKITSLDQLKGKSLARIRGGTEIKSLKAIPDIKYHLFNQHEDGIRLLKNGRVDVLLTADFRVLEAIERLNLSYDEIAPPLPVEARELWLYWSWKSNLDFGHVKKIKNGPSVAIEGFSSKTLFEMYQNKL